MENKMKMPANYNVMNEEEMTYTQGGSAIGAISALASTAFGIWNLYNYYKGMVATRNYVAAHKGQDTAALLEGGMNTYVNYLQKDLAQLLSACGPSPLWSSSLPKILRPDSPEYSKEQ